MVVRTVQDYLDGRRLPLETIYHHDT